VRFLTRHMAILTHNPCIQQAAKHYTDEDADAITYAKHTSPFGGRRASSTSVRCSGAICSGPRILFCKADTSLEAFRSTFWRVYLSHSLSGLMRVELLWMLVLRLVHTSCIHKKAITCSRVPLAIESTCSSRACLQRFKNHSATSHVAKPFVRIGLHSSVVATM
jgi:hypothetical protein